MDFVLKKINLGLRRFYYGKASIIDIKSVSRFCLLKREKRLGTFISLLIFERTFYLLQCASNRIPTIISSDAVERTSVYEAFLERRNICFIVHTSHTWLYFFLWNREIWWRNLKVVHQLNREIIPIWAR